MEKKWYWYGEDRNQDGRTGKLHDLRVEVEEGTGCNYCQATQHHFPEDSDLQNID
jgi:hypothetical protein